MKKIYIGEPNMALIGNQNLYLNEEGIVQVESGTWQENLCKDYKLKDLYELYNKYFADEIESLKINLQNEEILKKQVEELQKEIEALKKEKTKSKK
ncbi:hypothetical protein DLH72_05060 [Candidatus Gracilibacteria bacterium]|nr:MAG: hypothetical protein DLH72_05060 [Candidatus Gracilibacteria bacterium]